MFVSDFAIRRPIVTVVTMIALVVFGAAALAKLDTDEFPAIDAPIVFVAIAYPGAAPGRRRARSPHAHRRQDFRHQRRRQDQLDGDRRLRADHRPVRVLEAGRPGDAGHTRRHLRGARSTPGRNHRADHPALRPEPAADRVAGAHVERALAAAAHADRRPDDRRRAARDRRCRAGERRGRRQRAAQRQRPPERPRRAGCGHRSGRGRAPRAKSRGAGRQREQRARAAFDQAGRAARPPGGFLRARHLRAERRSSSRSARWPASRRGPRSRCRPRSTAGVRRSVSTS